MSGKRWADEDSSDDEEDLRQYRTDLQQQQQPSAKADDDDDDGGFYDRQFQEQQDRRYQQHQSGRGGGGGGGGSYRQSQEPRKGRGGGGGGGGGNKSSSSNAKNNRDRGNSRRGGGGGGNSRTDWKAEARASSQFSASAMSTNNQRLDGSSWMAKRRSKMEQQEAEARKINEERRVRAEKEAAERRAKQAEALEVSLLVDCWLVGLFVCSIRLLVCVSTSHPKFFLLHYHNINKGHAQGAGRKAKEPVCPAEEGGQRAEHRQPQPQPQPQPGLPISSGVTTPSRGDELGGSCCGRRRTVLPVCEAGLSQRWEASAAAGSSDQASAQAGNQKGSTSK